MKYTLAYIPQNQKVIWYATEIDNGQRDGKLTSFSSTKKRLQLKLKLIRYMLHRFPLPNYCVGMRVVNLYE